MSSVPVYWICHEVPRIGFQCAGVVVGLGTGEGVPAPGGGSTPGAGAVLGAGAVGVVGLGLGGFAALPAFATFTGPQTTGRTAIAAAIRAPMTVRGGRQVLGTCPPGCACVHIGAPVNNLRRPLTNLVSCSADSAGIAARPSGGWRRVHVQHLNIQHLHQPFPALECSEVGLTAT
jgi:hypothetical protein